MEVVRREDVLLGEEVAVVSRADDSGEVRCPLERETGRQALTEISQPCAFGGGKLSGLVTYFELQLLGDLVCFLRQTHTKNRSLCRAFGSSS